MVQILSPTDFSEDTDFNIFKPLRKLKGLREINIKSKDFLRYVSGRNLCPLRNLREIIF